MREKKSLLTGVAIGVICVLLLQFGLSTLNLPINIGKNKDMDVNKKMNQIYKLLDDNYINTYEKDKMEDALYAGFVYGVDDPYTTYMSKETLAKFMEQTQGKYAGIGVVVSPSPDKDNTILVVTPYEGAPGYNAGLRPGDKILKVNGVEVHGDSLDEAVTMIKGKAGTSVNVTVWSKAKNEEITVEIVRDDIKVPTVSYSMKDNNIGYIKITNFEDVTFDQFMTAYNDLTSQNMQGLIIDVRNNPGGLLHIVSKIADVLVPEGNIVYTEDSHGKKEYIKSDAKKIEIPLVMLVNGNSASASEVLSGAVKDYGVGKLVGTQTFGKGVVQNLYPLQDGSALKITMAKYYTPNGVSIHGIGIEPDFIVEMDPTEMIAEDFNDNVDVQLQKGLEVINSEIK